MPPRGQESRIVRLEERVEGHTTQIAERVTKDRFSPVEKIVYGLAASALLAMLGALSKLVLVGS